MQAWEQALERWQTAGVVDAGTAERVRAYEASEAQPAGQRWQVVVALIFGGVLLAAGILLFVAAHWDQVGPGMRLVTILGLLLAVHAGGVLAGERFPAMATALHGVGTIACGGAIAMAGQIFNMQEHWPAAVLLWALCALAGWLLLRDQFQQICLLLLVPAWIVCEWSYRGMTYSAAEVYLARMVAVLAAVYLCAFVHSRRRIAANVLLGVASILLFVSTTALNEGWSTWSRREGLPTRYRVTAALVIAITMAVGWLWERRSVLVSGAVLLMSFALPWLRSARYEKNYNGSGYTFTVPSVGAYAMVAAVAAFVAWWGVRERSRAVVNYAIAMFAVVVMWFYFSDLMDKLGRSLGLIGLGLLFLLGGWQLERLRRRLMQDMRGNSAAGVAA